MANDVSFTRQTVQLSGSAARIPREAFLGAVAKSAGLRGLLASHADAFAAQVLQTSACNAQHSTEERMARWLLMAFDRCATDRISLQAKTRIAAPYRAAFDYHWKLNMPADPIQPAARADCIF